MGTCATRMVMDVQTDAMSVMAVAEGVCTMCFDG